MSLSNMTRREYIASQWDCLTFATTVLGLHVDARGRAKSLEGQAGRGNEALVITPEVWYDHKKHVGGGVIQLCAWAMFNGDEGQAVNYLAGDFYPVNEKEYYDAIGQLRRKVEFWHGKLRPEDREYLHSRRITDETIERLQIGYSCYDDDKSGLQMRLMIPYFRNGRIVYYVSRDRSGIEGASKYMKMRLPRDKKGNDTEVLSNCPWGLHTISRKFGNTQETIEDAISGLNKSEWLIIAEGAFDAMSFEQEGYCVLSPMGGCFTQHELPEVIGHAKSFENVLVIFDNDNAGGKFQKDLAKTFFSHRVNFYVNAVPYQYAGKEIKDVSDYYTLGGDLAELVTGAVRGIEYLADTITDEKELKEFFYSAGRFAAKSEMIELFDRIKARRHNGLPMFNALWLKTIYEEAIKAPAEPVIIRELTDKHNLKYLEGNGFFEYQHGVWVYIPENRVKSYADQILMRYATNARITSAMKFCQARLSSNDPINTQPVINLRNGVILLNDNCRFVPHSPEYLSTIQLPFKYDKTAQCPLWEKFIRDIMNNDGNKLWLLQEIAGYILFPDNRLERCFFFMGAGGNGKGVFMDTLRDVFGRENCSALPLSSFGSNFDPIMLQYSLVNFCSENRVDLRGNTERIKEVTSGNEIVAAHKGIDAIKFSPRCKLITSCNEFFNTGEVTHALMRRLCFVKFENNYVKEKKADINLKDKLHEELPGILNWCIEGYLRLLAQKDFTDTQENEETKRDFMRSTNPVAYWIEDVLIGEGRYCGQVADLSTLYSVFKEWTEKHGYKTLSIGAFRGRFKTLMCELYPEVISVEKSRKTQFIFPEV